MCDAHRKPITHCNHTYEGFFHIAALGQANLAQAGARDGSEARVVSYSSTTHWQAQSVVYTTSCVRTRTNPITVTCDKRLHQENVDIINPTLWLFLLFTITSSSD
jgi:hypothetical protein